ncbi:hypothetical protein ACFDTO_07225 [Microbacteriaceae bacterium 4G12]
MLMEVGQPRTLGNAESAALRFNDDTTSGRFLRLDDEDAFELSFWCGTCQFLFKRLEGATQTLDLPEVQTTLNAGLEHIDESVLAAFSQVIEPGTYLPMLLQIQPRLVAPGRAGDYFSEEQVATWGVDNFWGLPQHPQVPYYRTWQSAVDDDAHMYEFIVPMVPLTYNSEVVVAEHAQRLRSSAQPTAVAVSTLDICAPATFHSTDYYRHWALTHFLLDGHHKLQAAAETGRPMQLLSLLSLDRSLATKDELQQVPQIRNRSASHRPHPDISTPTTDGPTM